MNKFLTKTFLIALMAVLIGPPTMVLYVNQAHAQVCLTTTFYIDTKSGSDQPAKSINVRPGAKTPVYIRARIADRLLCRATAARIFYVWNQNSDPINLSTTETELKLFDTIPTNVGRYTVQLQVSNSGQWTLADTQTVDSVVMNVERDGRGDTNPGNSNSGGTTTNPTNGNINGTVGGNVNTTVGANLNMDLDKEIGFFWNPLEGKVNSAPQLITGLIRILFALIGIVAVIIIIVSGFRMVMASGNEAELTKAKQAITWAIIGLVVSLLSFSIVAIIQRLIQVGAN